MTTRKRRRKAEMGPGRSLCGLLSLALTGLLFALVANSMRPDEPGAPARTSFPQVAAAAQATNSTPAQAQAEQPRVEPAAKQQDGKQKRQRVRVQANAQSANARNQASNRSTANLWRPTKNFRQQQDQPPSQPPALGSSLQLDQAAEGLQVSITPRVSLVRVPVESNAILKCLISAQSNNFTRPFKIRWSRFMYDESVYEQIESSSGFDEEPAPAFRPAPPADASRSKRDDDEQPTGPLEGAPVVVVANRQQELRDFLARSRQETNVISSLLIEATLSISPVKATDNASYFCTATDGSSDHNQARIDLVALARPVVRLDRVRPARDSKSALVHWSVLAHGNTPIKKTILMVRNDSQTFESRLGHTGGHFSNSARFPAAADTQGDPLQQQQHSSLVLDSERQQWQRIDIQGDGSSLQREQAQSSSAGGGSRDQDEESAARADVDVTSIGGGGGSGSSLGSSELAPWAQAPSSGRLGRRQRAFNLSGLQPGVTYQLRLAAINDMGQSEWSQLAATMPNEIPAQISDIVVLGTTNDSITIGWRRPPYDGAKTIRYEMQLFDLNRTLTLDANTNTNMNANPSANTSASGQARTNFMFHFVNLNAGTDYHFHIRACSRAGCSAFSSPRLLASTLDGEPDEPLDVELACQLAPGAGGPSNLSVSWLPPANPRGRLLNYSVTLESSARYRNASGHWTSDQWRTTMDTGDNHTLGLEAGNLLMPNTNYTARVCANNRSRRCGRASQLSARSRCSTPGELPRELPANIGLALRQQLETGQDEQQQQQRAETLVLELPFISWRNGTIDCLQVVLVRLPSSFGGSQRPLSDFLPDDPAKIRTQDYRELLETPAAANSPDRPVERAVAYLADELDQTAQGGTPEELALGLKQVFLGDGVQTSCGPPVRERLLQSVQTVNAQTATRPIQALDGPLTAQTYYTGFLKLIQLSGPNKRARRRQAGTEDPALVTSYSNYFSPVRTGAQVPEVSLGALVALGGNNSSSPAGAAHASAGLCAHKLVQALQEKLGLTSAPCLALAGAVESARRSVARLYVSARGYLGERVKLESLGRILDREQRQAESLQPLEIGLFVFVSALLLLFVVYLFTLPARLKRKRRLKVKRQLMLHEQAAAAQQASEESAGFHHHQPGPGETKVQLQPHQQQQQQQIMMVGHMTPGKSQQQQADHLQALTSSLGYQQVPPEQVQVHQSPVRAQHHAPATLRRPPECPVHSSPMSAQIGNGSQMEPNDNDQDEARFVPAHRRQSVHVCQQQQQDSQLMLEGHYGQQQPANASHHHAHQNHPHHPHHHAHNHHHQSAYQLDLAAGGDLGDLRGDNSAHFMDYERNCRTMSRRQLADNSRPLTNGGQQQQQAAYADQARYHTMTMQHNSVLALAKKINKPLPLGLLSAVLETRLKNGWLREEFEQLPRCAQQPPAAAAGSPDHGRRLIKLRPQLIVSRDDAISALISGNDHYEGSLVKLPVALDEQPQVATTVERQFICAKSPIDPDSVWDFWRLVYEREVATLVMLTPNGDLHTGDIRCAQYWPTCDNEETTILSPCNEFVQQSGILPAKFKIRQETLTGADADGSDEFVVRRLTLLVMATRPSENEHAAGQAGATPPSTNDENTSKLAGGSRGDAELRGVPPPPPPPPLPPESPAPAAEDDDEADDEERLVIVERNLLHFQFLHWNASSPGNQTKLIRFIELVNERHARSIQLQASPGADWQQLSPQIPVLVHCANGLGRSGLFTAMSFVIDDLGRKLAARAGQREQQQQQMAAKLNLFQLVARMRAQRDMLLSPYRFYELLYQLTARCIPSQGNQNTGQLLHQRQHQHHNHHHHHHHHSQNHNHNHAHNQVLHQVEG